MSNWEQSVYAFFNRRSGAVKALMQMGIGLVTLGAVAVSLISNFGESPAEIQRDALNFAGAGLAVAAAIELVHTLFTPGPDEALRPVTLGLSAALILQLAKVDSLDLEQAAAVLLFVAALAGLFATDRFLFDSAEENAGADRPPVGPQHEDDSRRAAVAETG